MNKQIIWINSARAICIISVFLIHCSSYYGFGLGIISDVVHPFYVNAFFFISGYLFFRKQMSESIIRKSFIDYLFTDGKQMFYNILFRIVIPTVVFSLIEFFPSHILKGEGWDCGTFLYKTLGGGTYWFTAALAIAELTIALFLLLRVKSFWFYFGLCCGIFAIGQFLVCENFCIIERYPSFPWQYKQGLLAILFVGFGGVYCMLEDRICKYLNKIFFLCLLFLYVTCIVFLPKSFHVLISILDVNTAGIVLSLMSIVVLVEFCKHLPSFRFLDYIGQNTIGFYFMSGALPIILSMFVHKFIHGNNVWGCMIVFVSSMFIACIAVMIMNHWLPWMFDLRMLRSKRK